MKDARRLRDKAEEDDFRGAIAAVLTLADVVEKLADVAEKLADVGERLAKKSGAEEP